MKSHLNSVCLTSPAAAEPARAAAFTATARQERWRSFAPQIVSEQVKGFDWIGYQARMHEIRTDSKVLIDDPKLREMHSHFARILLAYVQMAEADLELARISWERNVPTAIGVPSFLDAKWLSSFDGVPDMQHLFISGKPTSEAWNLVRRSIHHRQDSGDLLVVLDPINPYDGLAAAVQPSESSPAR